MPPRSKSARTSPKAPKVAPPDDFQSDSQTALHRCARDADERRAALAEALGRWATEDIKRLERVDEPGRCGWAMWTNALP